MLPDGRKFDNVDDFKRLLLADPDPIARCIAQKLIVYATGTPIRPADRAVVTEIVQRIRARDRGMRTLIHEVVSSELFLNK